EELNPNPAVAIDRGARRNPFAAKSMGFCLCADINHRCLERMLKLMATTCQTQNDFATSQSDAFAAPGLRLAFGKSGLNAKSGVNGSGWDGLQRRQQSCVCVSYQPGTCRSRGALRSHRGRAWARFQWEDRVLQ